MACGACGATQDVDVGSVRRGCRQLEKAFELFLDVKDSIIEATECLNHNNLRFGGAYSTLEEALVHLQTQIDNCIAANADVVSTISGNATEQKRQWNNHQRVCLKPKEEEKK